MRTSDEKERIRAARERLEGACKEAKRVEWRKNGAAEHLLKILREHRTRFPDFLTNRQSDGQRTRTTGESRRRAGRDD